MKLLSVLFISLIATVLATDSSKVDSLVEQAPDLAETTSQTREPRFIHPGYPRPPYGYDFCARGPSAWCSSINMALLCRKLTYCYYSHRDNYYWQYYYYYYYGYGYGK